MSVLLDAMGTADELTVEQVQHLLFAERTPAAGTKALERLVKQVNTDAVDKGADLQIQVHGAKKLGARGRTLSFWAERDDVVGAPLREHEAVRDVLIEDRKATVLGPRRLVLCNAPADDATAGPLWDLLFEALVGEQHGIAVWRSDKDVLAGDDRERQFRMEVAGSELVVVAVSNAWYAQPALGEPLRTYSGSFGPTVMPVLLRPTSSRAGGFETKTIYPSGSQAVPFIGLRNPARDKWVNGLVEHIHRQLDRASAKPLDMGTKDRRILKETCGDQFFDLHGRPGGMDPNTVDGAHDQERRVEDVVAYLMEWARDPDSAPLAALLGEYGTGKTITCQELTERLQAQPAPLRPEPLYFDLRRLGNLSNIVPPLPAILTECINHGWAANNMRLPSGEEVIARAQNVPTLFIIDGLDEVLVRLDAAQGADFTHELLKLRPIRVKSKGTVYAPFAGVDTKVLLSCRTHYFRSLREQSRHFLEYDRDLATAEDYVALLLLPLTDMQIRGYLNKALPDQDVAQVMDMLGAVHDLSDLATRPYTLTKVAAQIPFIEDRLSQQRPVHAATIYRQVLRDWLERDRGKHRLRSDHKLTLMARLAAWSWRRGARRVDSADLDDWLDEQLATDPALGRRYGNISRDQLEEDLRTATFVVRNDHSGPDRPDFQFAHSSIHEYFLAQYLCDAIHNDRREDWCLPHPSVETLDFLGQLIADDDDQEALRATLNRWRTSYLEGASELWLRYALHARAHERPHPTLAGCDLSGARLRGWEFIGTRAAPLIFTAANLAGADLRETRWGHVDLTRTRLEAARLERSVLHETAIVNGTLRNADLTGAFLHRCRLDNTDLTGVNTNQLRHVHSGDYLPTPQPPVRTQLRSVTRHSGSVRGVVFSPDGARLAAASSDGTVLIWDVSTGENLHTLTAGDGLLRGVVFSPDGARLAAAGTDGTVLIWDVSTGENLHTLTAHAGPVHDVVFSPDGRRLAAAGRHAARIWDVSTGETLHTFTAHAGPVRGVVFSPDGRRLAAAGGRTVVIWDVSTGETLHTFTAHAGPVRGVVFSPDGTRLAAAGDGTVLIWDVSTGETLHTFTAHAGPVEGVVFSPDGTRLAAAGDGTVLIWDVSTGETLHTPTAQDGRVEGVVFSPDGRRLAVAGRRVVLIWDVSTGETLHTFTAHAGPVRGVAFSPDGTRLATASSGTARIWDLSTGETLHTFTAHIAMGQDVAFSPDGTRLATASSGTARIWDLSTGENLHTLTAHTDWVWGVAFSPDGRRLAAAGRRVVVIWDVSTGETLHTFTAHAGPVRGVVFSPDGTRLAAAGRHAVVIWDVSTGETLHTFTAHAGLVHDVAFSPDGTRLATASGDGTVLIWDVSTGETLHTFTAHAGPVRGVVFSPDGRRLGTVGRRTARIWDVSTGETLHTFTAHAGPVRGVVFSPDGTRLAAAGGRTVVIWDVSTGETLHTFTAHAGLVYDVAFSPDGTRLATASDDNTTRIWDTSTGQLDLLLASFSRTSTASWSPGRDTLLSTTGDAWLFLRAACFDSQNRLVGLQPYELYYNESGSTAAS
nr:pentapeptide repeat-containing protein [Amycolatopsis alba]